MLTSYTKKNSTEKHSNISKMLLSYPGNVLVNIVTIPKCEAISVVSTAENRCLVFISFCMQKFIQFSGKGYLRTKIEVFH